MLQRVASNQSNVMRFLRAGAESPDLRWVWESVARLSVRPKSDNAAITRSGKVNQYTGVECDESLRSCEIWCLLL